MTTIKTITTTVLLDVSEIKPKSASFENGKSSINCSSIGTIYEGILNKTTKEIEGIYNEGGTILSLKKRKSKNESRE